MLKELVEYLENKGFMVQNTSLEQVIEDNGFREAILTSHRNTTLSEILTALPTLFVIHKKLPPQECALMLRVLGKREKLTKSHARVYRLYYPPQLALIYLGTSLEETIVAWARNCISDNRINLSKMKPLHKFIDKLLSSVNYKQKRKYKR